MLPPRWTFAQVQARFRVLEAKTCPKNGPCNREFAMWPGLLETRVHRDPVKMIGRERRLCTAPQQGLRLRVFVPRAPRVNPNLFSSRTQNVTPALKHPAFCSSVWASRLQSETQENVENNPKSSPNLHPEAQIHPAGHDSDLHLEGCAIGTSASGLSSGCVPHLNPANIAKKL